MSTQALAMLADVDVCSLSQFERGMISLPAEKVLRIQVVLHAAQQITANSPVPVDWRKLGRLRELVGQMIASAEPSTRPHPAPWPPEGDDARVTQTA
jgi:DNA-binding transcriptional regulator YdaS (Cro superfamily)